MKHTNNYHLPQWSEDDLILMEDFNQMNRDIEAGIDGAKAEAKAGDAELQRQVNAANKKAEDAQNVAGGAYSPSFKPYAVGTFVGNGQDMDINLGFRPSFVIISGVMETMGAFAYNDFYVYAAITAGQSHKRHLVFTDTGFTLRAGMIEGYTYPDFTYSGRSYDYIAFR